MMKARPALLFFLSAAAAGLHATPTDLGTLGGLESAAFGVSANGEVIVGHSDTVSAPRAFIWTLGGGMIALPTLGGNDAIANGISANGLTVVGQSSDGTDVHAFSWTLAGGIIDLGAFGGTNSYARAVSADGSVVAGSCDVGVGSHAFMWTSLSGMSDLGTLSGTGNSWANGISSDGSVIVGTSSFGGPFDGVHAYRWTQGGGMVDLSTLTGGVESWAHGVSADGNVVVGSSLYAAGIISGTHAFRWTQAGGMVDLGALGGGDYSVANGVSGNGNVVVGASNSAVAGAVQHAFRWTQAGGMVDLGTLGGANSWASAASQDGSVIVGSSELLGGSITHAFLYANNVMLDWDNWMSSLNGPNSVLAMASHLASLPMEGAHHRPLMSFDHMGKASQVWATGDFGASSRKTDTHMTTGEIGTSTTMGDFVVGLSAGHGSQNQELALGGSAHVSGNYVLAEADYRLADKQSIVSVVLMSGNWTSTTARAYTTGAGPSVSNGTTGVSTESLRLRYDGPVQPIAGQLTATPFISTTWTRTKADAYAESGGSFAATFDAQSHTSSEGRLGLTAKYALTADTTLLVTGEWIHRFDRTSGTLSGVDTATGLLPFAVAGLAPTANQARLGLDVDHKLNANTLLNFSAHVAGFGETPDVSVALSIRRAF